MSTRPMILAGIAAVAAWAAVSADTPLPLISPEALLASEQAGGDAAPFVLDVRTPDEFASGYVPGAVNIPHDQLASRLGEVPKDRDVVLYCRSGRRAELAGEVLARNGYTRLRHLDGDIAGWQAAKRPVGVPRDPPGCAAALKAGQASPAACAPR